MTRVLVVGTPRSGSTWTAEILGMAGNAQMVHEPDNAAINPPAALVTRTRGLFPVIDAEENAPDYQALWDLAFAGGWPNVGITRATGRALRRLPPRALELLLRAASPAATRLRRRPLHVVAKSVYATFSVEWLAQHYQSKVVVVERDPLNVVASWLDLKLPFGDLDRSAAVSKYSADLAIPPPDPEAAMPARVAWGVGFLMTVMKRNAARHPDWHVIDHGRLILDPTEEFSKLFSALGLDWTPQADAHIAASDRPGTGFSRARLRSDLSDAWRRRLTNAQAEDITAVLARFPALFPGH